MMKLLNPIEALAKIKIIIKRFYEQLGRNEGEGNEAEVITDIENIVDRVKIPAKNLLVEDFRAEREGKGEPKDI